MRPLIEILHERQHQSAAEFHKLHACPVLVHRLNKQAEIGLSAETQFVPRPSLGGAGLGGALGSLSLANTKATIHLLRALGSLGASTPQSIADGSVLVFAVKPRPGAAARDALSVGRAEAAVCLPFPKISKLHAHLTLTGDRAFLADAGSRNGTRVAGKILESGQRVEIENGTLIQFSQYSFLYFSAAGFLRLLSGDD